MDSQIAMQAAGPLGATVYDVEFVEAPELLTGG